MSLFRFFNGFLLARAVEVFLPLAEEGIINYSPTELSLVVSEPSGLFKAALRINSSEFTLFLCNESFSERVKLQELYGKLNRCIDDELVIFAGGGHSLGFLYNPTNFLAGTEEPLYSHLTVTQIYNENKDIKELQNFYEVSVCLRSQEFMNFATYLQQFGSTVHMRVKNLYVVFEVEGVELAVSTWNNQCHISGVVQGNFLCSSFSLNYMNSLWSASLLQSIVLIGMPKKVFIGSSATVNCMLGYPFIEVV